jgi:FkbM family methyltransferase
MISRLARFANDCYHVWKAPTGSKTAILRDLILPGERKMGFRVTHFDRRTLNYLYREIFVRQHYYFRARNETPAILDCGANVGMASVYFKWLYPKARVQAFEPDPATFQLLKRNIARNMLDVEIHNCALWDENTEVDFFPDSTDPGGLLMSTVASRCKGERVKVPGRRLSDFIDGTIDFVKLDVEGAEHRVLSELVQSGRVQAIRAIVIEYHHRLGGQKSCLAEFLLMLEHAGFEYQIHAGLYPASSNGVFQDMLIAAYREGSDLP